MVSHAVVRIDVEIVFPERELFAAKRAILKVENALGVEGLTHIARLEVEVGPRAAPCVATVTNQFAGFDDVAALDNET